MDKHTETIRRLLLTSCLSVFDHFVGLAVEGLIWWLKKLMFGLSVAEACSEPSRTSEMALFDYILNTPLRGKCRFTDVTMMYIYKNTLVILKTLLKLVVASIQFLNKGNNFWKIWSRGRSKY